LLGLVRGRGEERHGVCLLGLFVCGMYIDSRVDTHMSKSTRVTDLDVVEHRVVVRGHADGAGARVVEEGEGHAVLRADGVPDDNLRGEGRGVSECVSPISPCIWNKHSTPP
jgi:hypothetical protein